MNMNHFNKLFYFQDPEKEKLMTAALLCPLEKIGLETDSPYLPPTNDVQWGKWGAFTDKETGARSSVPSNVYALAAIIGSIKDINPINVLGKCLFKKA